MKKLFMMFFVIFPMCLNGMEPASASPLRGLISQFNTIYQPIARLDLDNVSLDEVPNLLRQLDLAWRLVGQMSAKNSESETVCVEDAQLLGYKPSRDEQMREFFEADPAVLVHDQLVFLENHIKLMLVRLGGLKKNFDRFYVPPCETVDCAIQTGDDFCYVSPVVSMEQAIAVVPYKARCIPAPVMDIVDTRGAIQSQAKLHCGRLANGLPAVATQALVFGAVWFITSVLCPDSGTAK